ncbi:1-phosphofructokinase family hexose kinase [Catenuloplanes japonicus]|uniref:1-phosphofructokinase family hexose kinase n=1 Tax=Catenuloplanes japonicus TaxID=33876 RepID=UPI000527AF8E|nr:hexose kinase [Catenuloplanes japonicus]
MTRVLTVTLNPALDVTYEVSALLVGRSVRVREVRSRAGGKGVNVASVVRALGGEGVVLAPSALTTPDPFRDGLDALGLPHRLVPAFESVRQTVAVVGADGATTILLEPGRTAIEGTEEALVSAVASELDGADALVVSGSLPPGLPPALPSRLAALAGAHGVPVIVDVSGPALRAAAGSGAVLTPNIDELSELVGTHVGVDDVTVHARRLVDAGAAAVIVTLGEKGALAVTPTGVWRAHAATFVDGNPTGAGDAAAAALAMHLARGTAAGRPVSPATDRPGAAAGTPDSGVASDGPAEADGRSATPAVDWPAALADAVATSAACVLRPVAGEIDPQARARWRDTITVEELT